MTALQPLFGLMGLVYGDSGIFVRRQEYERIGGFRPFALFEELDLVCRLRRRGRVVRVPATVVASSRRFERGRSFTLTFAGWVVLQRAVLAGRSPEHIGPPLRCRPGQVRRPSDTHRLGPHQGGLGLDDEPAPPARHPPADTPQAPSRPPTRRQFGDDGSPAASPPPRPCPSRPAPVPGWRIPCGSFSGCTSYTSRRASPTFSRSPLRP